MPQLDEKRAELLAAEASSYAKIAKKLEERGDSKQAREKYLDAAQKFLEASKNSVSNKKNTRKDLSNYFLKRAKLMGQVKSSKKEKQEVKGKGSMDASKIILAQKTGVTFDQIGGLEEVKEVLRMEVIYPFEKPEIYELYGRKPGAGVLLYGPPGCGKTLLAKAVAGESNATFLAPDPAELLSQYVGESEKNIKQVFDLAAEYDKVVIYLDELDSLIPRTGPAYIKRMKNEFLQQIDGISSKQQNRLILGTTNRPWLLDTALRRPGRLGKIIFVPQPDYDARRAIFGIMLKQIIELDMLADDVDIDELGKLTDGFSGADINQICTDAGDIPLRETLRGNDSRKIKRADFLSILGTGRVPSVIPWYQDALKSIRRYKEEAVFAEMIEKGEAFLANFT